MIRKEIKEGREAGRRGGWRDRGGKKKRSMEGRKEREREGIGRKAERKKKRRKKERQWRREGGQEWSFVSDHFWYFGNVQEVLGLSLWICGSWLVFSCSSKTSFIQVRTIMYLYQAKWSTVLLILEKRVKYFLRKVYPNLRDRKMCAYMFMLCLYIKVFYTYL